MEERYDPVEWKYDRMEWKYDRMEERDDPMEHGCIFVQSAPPYRVLFDKSAVAHAHAKKISVLISMVDKNFL